MTDNPTIARLTRPGIIAVIRASGADCVPPVCEALVSGGVTALEITLTTPDALRLIREMTKRFGVRAVFGAGSVTDARACVETIQAGAGFVVSPICKPEIAVAARAAGRAVMLGAYTPTEAQAAFEAGADFIKIFPADKLGPDYIKALRAPLPHLRIVPTGGVELGNVGKFFQAGCVAVGVGSSLITREILQSKDWNKLTALAREFVTAAERPKAQ